MFITDSPHVLLEKDSLTGEERRALLDEYVSRGRALRLENDRGIIDSHRRREAHKGQFFTPTTIARAMAQVVGLADHPAWEGAWSLPAGGSVVDFAGCGNGRLLQFAPEGWTVAGADVDPLAVRAAKLIFPNAEIIEGDLLTFRGQGEKFTVALLNPPFSLQLASPEPLKMASAQWGVWGKGTSAPSHLAAMELGLRMAEVVAMILPTSALLGDDSKAIRKILNPERFGASHDILLRIDLPAMAFKDEGTEWPCSILVIGAWGGTRKHYVCEDMAAVQDAISDWVGVQRKERESRPWHCGTLLRVLSENASGQKVAPTLSGWLVQPKRSLRTQGAGPSHSPDAPSIRVCLGGRAHKIMLKPNGLIAALAVQEAKLWDGYLKGSGFVPQSMLGWSCDLVRNAGSTERKVEEVVAKLKALPGVSVSVDAQVWNHVRKADRKAQAEATSFGQFVRVGDDEWEERGKDTLGSAHPAYSLIQARERLFGARAEALETGLTLNVWDRKLAKHVKRSHQGFPIYAFSRKDIMRVLSVRSAIYSAKQGLAKTRFAIGAVLASGAPLSVFVLHSRLVNEFKRELKKIGFLDHFKQIDKAADLKDLKLFNVITYNRIWKPIVEGGETRTGESWGPGKSFAAALARFRPFLVLDEAHAIKTATSKQGKACRHLAQRSRRVLMLTGTAVQSYARNILGLVNAGWGDGSSFNPYGYRRAIEGGYAVSSGRSWRQREPVIRGVQAFVDALVEVMWYSPEFAQTASGGMKSREIPKIKDMRLWNSWVRPKLIRRVPGEPEVRASGVATPEANPVHVAVKPDPAHFAFYKLVLDHFASIWEERIERERETGKSENSAAWILPELDALRFSSTVPVKEHRWAATNPVLRYGSTEPTAVMKEALKRVAAWVEAGDRVVVGAAKPDALRWFADLLADLPKYVPDSEPIASVLALHDDINKRNEAIDQVRDGSEIPVLLLSIGKGKEGYNLVEFSKLLTLDYDWTPGDLDQFAHRILRPGQTADVEIIHLHHEGMIDAYMRQLNAAKADAISEAIDGQDSTFDYNQWMSYRDFCLEMLEREGYAFASEVLRREREAAAAA